MICTQVTQISHSTVGSSFSVSFSADSTPNDLEMLRMMREWFMRWNNSGVSFTRADTPQTEQMKTADYCDICKQDMCKDCIADATNPYCVPSHYEINYEPKDEPQTERSSE